jgi:steroid delta-isomerase-like uncharacterized protein
MSQENRAVLDRLNDEVLRQRKVDVLDELLADDFVEHDPPPGVAGDREGFKDLMRTVHQAFDDQVHTVYDQIAEGDRVVERWDMTATHVGDWMGIAPTGKRITLSGIDISRLENGRMVEHWMQIDLLGLFEQLGAIPAPDGEGEAR